MASNDKTKSLKDKETDKGKGTVDQQKDKYQGKDNEKATQEGKDLKEK